MDKATQIMRKALKVAGREELLHTERKQQNPSPNITLNGYDVGEKIKNSIFDIFLLLSVEAPGLCNREVKDIKAR